MWDVYMIGNGNSKIAVIQDGIEKEIIIPDEAFYTVEDRENGLIINEDGERALSSGNIPRYYYRDEYILARIKARAENSRDNQQDIELRG